MKLFRSRKSRNRRTSRTSRKRRQSHLLEVTATAETQRRRRNQKLFLHSAEFLLLGGVLALLWFGGRTLVNRLLFENRQYRVAVVEVNTDGLMSREEAMAKAGIELGVNIFSLNIDAGQRALQSIPEVKHALVERIPPDKVTISLEARKPVAWVAPRDTGEDPSVMANARLVDGESVIMKPQTFDSMLVRLPVVYGVPTEQWSPGDVVDLPELRAALQLFERAASRKDSEVPLRAADISKGWCILAWGDPATRFTFGVTDLDTQLDRLQFILLHTAQTTRKLATVNLIPERNTPVTYQGEVAAPAAQGPPTTADATARKKQR